MWYKNYNLLSKYKLCVFFVSVCVRRDGETLLIRAIVTYEKVL
jgi:hypothetical protein